MGNTELTVGHSTVIGMAINEFCRTEGKQRNTEQSDRIPQCARDRTDQPERSSTTLAVVVVVVAIDCAALCFFLLVGSSHIIRLSLSVCIPYTPFPTPLLHQHQSTTTTMKLLTFLILPSFTCALRGAQNTVTVHPNGNGSDGALPGTDPTATYNWIDRIPCPGPFFSRTAPEIVDCADDDEYDGQENVQPDSNVHHDQPESITTTQRRVSTTETESSFLTSNDNNNNNTTKKKKKNTINSTRSFVLEANNGQHYYCCTLLSKLQDWSHLTTIQGHHDDDRLGLAIQNGAGVVLNHDGTIVAVTSRQSSHNVGGKHAGDVRVYHQTPFGWELSAAPIVGRADGEHFGWAVAMAQDGRMVVGSSVRGHGNRGTYQGLVRAFVYDDAAFPPVWKQLGGDLHGDDALDYFGHSVAVGGDGTVMAIGAIQHFGIENKSYAGYVKVFSWNGQRWDTMGDTLRGRNDDDKFGSAVSLSENGKVLAVGASGGERGAVSVYRYSDSQWEQVGQTLSGKDEQEHFGYSLSLSVNGRTVAVGAPRAGRESTGAVRVYHLRTDVSNDHPDMVWDQVGQDMYGQTEDDEFGSSVDLTGDGGTVLVGSPHGHGDKEAFEGQVRTFVFRNHQRWELQGSPVVGQTGSENFGYSVGISKDGRRMAASAPYTDKGDEKHVGELRIYEMQ